MLKHFLSAWQLLISLHACSLSQYLEVLMDALKLFCIMGQLVPDVLRVGENALEVSPCALNRQPRANDQISHHQLPLPAAHLHHEILHILTHENILQLNLGNKFNLI